MNDKPGTLAGAGFVSPHIPAAPPAGRPRPLPDHAAMLRRLAALLLAASALCSPARAQDAGEFVVRLNRLENQMRQMSGQIEQLQFENRQLREQARKFQEDVEFRFQESRGGQAAGTPAQGAGGQTPARPQPAPQRRSDAFEPGAPGAPQPLGSTAPSSPPARPGGAPSIAGLIEEDQAGGPGAPLDLGGVGRPGAPGGAPAAPRPPAAPSVAATGTGNARADYDAAYAYMLQRQYEQAEMGFRQFIQSHPRDRLVPDATFWLGESYLQRNRHREAAEQFLKISTQFPASSKGADAMLKLGVSLNALGARDQACATFAELERKYPQAASNVRQGVDREQKRARCPA